MPTYNLNSGYGRLLVERLESHPLAVTGGKIFMVSPTTHPNYDTLQQLFTEDGDGLPRLYTTLAAALANVVADRGDLIFLAEGYSETITAAAGSGVAKAGVRIIGLGDGANRPTFTFTTAVAASFDITAARVYIYNCIFTCGIDAQTAMININTADVTIDNCDVNTNSGTVGAVVGILTAATAARLKVVNCRFLGPATNSGTTTTAQIDHEVGVDYTIENNYFTGKCTQNITNGAAVLRGEIRANRFVTYTGTKSINMHASSTPFITNNRFNVPSGTAPVVAAAGFVAGNTYSAAAGVTAGTASTF